MFRSAAPWLVLPALVLTPPAGRAQTPPAQALANMSVDIPFTKYTLCDGLTLIVNEDTKAPVVHFKIWYHVGSKSEPAQRDRPLVVSRDPAPPNGAILDSIGLVRFRDELIVDGELGCPHPA